MTVKVAPPRVLRPELVADESRSTRRNLKSKGAGELEEIAVKSSDGMLAEAAIRRLASGRLLYSLMGVAICASQVRAMRALQEIAFADEVRVAYKKKLYAQIAKESPDAQVRRYAKALARVKKPIEETTLKTCRMREDLWEWRDGAPSDASVKWGEWQPDYSGLPYTAKIEKGEWDAFVSAYGRAVQAEKMIVEPGVRRAPDEGDYGAVEHARDDAGKLGGGIAKSLLLGMDGHLYQTSRGKDGKMVIPDLGTLKGFANVTEYALGEPSAIELFSVKRSFILHVEGSEKNGSRIVMRMQIDLLDSPYQTAVMVGARVRFDKEGITSAEKVLAGALLA